MHVEGKLSLSAQGSKSYVKPVWRYSNYELRIVIYSSLSGEILKKKWKLVE